MPLDAAENLWIVSVDEKNRERIVCNDPIIIEAVSAVTNGRIDRGLPLATVVKNRDNIRAYADNYDENRNFYRAQLLRFADYLDEKAGSAPAQEAEERFAAGIAQFSDLARLYRRGTKVVTTHCGVKIGAIVSKTELFTWEDFGGRKYKSLHVTLTVYHHSADGFEQAELSHVIDEFKGVRTLDGLALRLADDEAVRQLSERGAKLRGFAFDPTHVEYEGTILVPQRWRSSLRPATGRAMIDAKTLWLSSPDAYASMINMLDGHSFYRGGQPKNHRQDIDDDREFAVLPWAIGYSLAAKCWGLFLLDAIEPARYDHKAFDALVLDPDTKSLLKSIVRNSGVGFTDVIRGKGGGTTILLHGEPGVGKTLTAEAIAELLERPLYAISVGELGSSPKSLEKGLTTVLSYAAAWNAVLLLDEADIYLEQRDADIVRNAMTAIFLRLLEYYNGCLFLTTNRVRRFDRAFHSRIALAIRYPSLDETARTQVWENLLEAAGVTGIDPRRFAGQHSNGREIKNVIRMAQQLAADEGKTLTPEHLERVLGVMERFSEDIAADAPADPHVASGSRG